MTNSKRYKHVPMLCEECTKPLAVREKSCLATCSDCEWNRMVKCALFSPSSPHIIYMGMRRYQSVEKTEVVPPKQVEVRLAKVGATNAQTLTDKERAQAQLLSK